ncbi:hypothetical protein BASA81_005496 [Batrachochytrium salamandrivorans]|nr:hypothetical protein BASA81_005496 [Batrachochytrium salamandrivorans]
MKSLTWFLVCAAWVLALLTRVDMFQKVDSRTGINMFGFSPLDVVAHFSLQTAKLHGGESQVYLALQVVGVPGEVYRELLDIQDEYNEVLELSPKQVWERVEELLETQDDYSKLSPRQIWERVGRLLETQDDFGSSLKRSLKQVWERAQELYREVLDNFGKLLKLSPKQIWKRAGKWTHEGKMKQVINNRYNRSGFAAMGTLLAAIAAPSFPRKASLLFFASLSALQFTLHVSDDSVMLDETWGFYSIGLAFIYSVI